MKYFVKKGCQSYVIQDSTIAWIFLVCLPQFAFWIWGQIKFFLIILYQIFIEELITFIINY